MTPQKIASLVAKIEGKKTQARIGEVREIIKILVNAEVQAQIGAAQNSITEIGPLNALYDRALTIAQNKIVKLKKK